MDLGIAHPHWIVAGLLLLLGGFGLFRWARRNDSRAQIAAATTEAALNKLLKNSAGKAPKPGTAALFRNAMAQFLGILGIVMMIAGLVLIVFGMLYVAG